MFDKVKIKVSGSGECSIKSRIKKRVKKKKISKKVSDLCTMAASIIISTGIEGLKNLNCNLMASCLSLFLLSA